MSLINDALKRAKQVQAATPLPITSGPAFRASAEANANPPENATHRLMKGVVLLAAFGAVCVAWQLFRAPRGERADIQAIARPAPVCATAPLQEPGIDGPAVPARPIAQPAPALTNSEPVPATPPREAVPPKRQSALKLQAIFFSPNRPSAIINGKSVFVGDYVGEQQVMQITQNSATLVGAGVTNRITVPQ